MMLDIGVTSSIQRDRLISILRSIDENVFHCVWIGEDLDKPYDVFVKASFTLMNTYLNVGIGITSIFFRDTPTIARAAASLSEVGRGRFRLGIGVGGLQHLRRMGVKVEKPISSMRETATLLRRIWRGEIVSHRSSRLNLRRYSLCCPYSHMIPIFFGVRGLRLLELAGEVSDGVILSGPKTYLEEAVCAVRRGAEKVNRSIEDICVVVWLPTMLTLERKHLESARRIVAFILADTPLSILSLSRIRVDDVLILRRALAEGGLDAAARLVDDEMLNEMIFYGDAGDICNSLLSLERIHVDEVVYGPPFGVDEAESIIKVAEAWKRI